MYPSVIMNLQPSNIVLMVTLLSLVTAVAHPRSESSNYFDEERIKRSVPGAAIKILLRGAKRVREDESTIWYQKHGGYTRAMDEFVKTQPSEVRNFARGSGRIGHVGNRQVFIIRHSRSSGVIGVTDETTYFQRKDLYIDYIE